MTPNAVATSCHTACWILHDSSSAGRRKKRSCSMAFPVPTCTQDFLATQALVFAALKHCRVKRPRFCVERSWIRLQAQGIEGR